MVDEPNIKNHYGDYVEFDCVCGEPMSLVWQSGSETCEKCGRTWTLRSDVVLVGTADDPQSSE